MLIHDENSHNVIMNTNQYKHTVFTPIYNRANLIDEVYESICGLDYPKEGFEWLIIDDGSTDNLEDHLVRYKMEDKVNIRCIHKPNGGIHTAMNLAIKEAKGEYITRIDSDDILLPDALRSMDRWLGVEKTVPEENFIGVVGCCINRNDGKIRGSEFPFEYEDTTGHEIRVKYKSYGDRSFCMKTVVMRQYPIPEYSDVKWVPEKIIWDRIDLAGYITRFVSTPFSMTSEHAQGSMLDSVKDKKKNSSLLIKYYTAYHQLTETLMWLTVKEKIKQSSIYLAAGRVTRKHNNYMEAITKLKSGSRIWTIISLPCAVLLERRYR